MSIYGMTMNAHLDPDPYVACHHEVAAATGMKRELLLEVRHSQIAVIGLTKHGLPLLGNGSDTHTQQGYGTCVSERQELLAHLVVVKQDDVASILFHNSVT